VYNQLSPKGQVDTYILGFDSTNTLIWNTYIAGTDPEAALSIDFNPNGNRIMTAGLASSPAKNMSSGYNYFPCVKPGAPYTGIWYTNSINADINDQTVYAGPYDGYLGWFYTAIPVGIKEYFIDKAHSAEDLIQLFPNPTNDKFFIALDKSYNKNVKIDVYNQVGQLVYTQIIPEAFEKTIVPLTTYNMKNGIYIVTVSDNTKSTSKKLIIAGK